MHAVMKYISVGMRIHVGNSVWVKGPFPLGKGSLPMIGYFSVSQPVRNTDIVVFAGMAVFTLLQCLNGITNM